jgi:ribosome biogenesis protein SSF1/2
MPKQGRRRKKKRTEKENDVSEQEKKRTPRCFVVKQGQVGDRVQDLVKDFREVMMPNCAKNLRESRRNRLEDFVAVAGQFGVTHLISFTATKVATYMKLARLPQGPTLTFRIDSFTLARDVRASQKRPRAGQRDLTSAPLQVMSGFGGGGKLEEQLAHQKLEAEMLRGLFPPVDVTNFNQEECRRAALFHCDKEADTIHFRHFSVSRRPFGLQRGVQKLMRLSRLPKMGKRQDIADYLMSGGDASESEAEDGEEAPSANGGKMAVRLTESGPRMTLLLVKAEEGVCSGGVLYHRYKTKTPSQRQLLEQKAQAKRKLLERAKKAEAQVQGAKAKLLSKEKRKQELATKKSKKGGQKSQGDGGDDEEEANKGSALEEGFIGMEQAKGSEAPGKRKRFHPFAWGAKASKKAAKGGEKTVEMDDRPGKKPKRERGGGGGKPAITAKAAQKRAGGGGGNSVMDKYRRSAKTR